MDRNASVMRLVDGRERRPPIHRRQPARVTMGQDIEFSLLRFRFPELPENLQSVITDGTVDRNILITDLRCLYIGRRDAIFLRQR